MPPIHVLINSAYCFIWLGVVTQKKMLVQYDTKNYYFGFVLYKLFNSEKPIYLKSWAPLYSVIIHRDKLNLLDEIIPTW